MNEIKKLTDYLHIRTRINMYLGSKDNHTQNVLEIVDGSPIIKEVTWVPALYTGFREILDNASDEVVGHGFGNEICVDYDEDKKILSVSDNGRGIPFDFDKTEGMCIATMVLTQPRTGRNFDERANVAGANGIGAKATSNTAEWMDVLIKRNGEEFHQRYEETKGSSLKISKPDIIPFCGKTTGTKITYSPSKKVYTTLNLPLEFVKSRVTEFAMINPTVTVKFNGTKINVKGDIQKFLFPKRNSIMININDKETKFQSKFVLVPDFTTEEEHYHSIVNNIFAFEGGTHIESFRLGFARGLISALSKESKKRKLTPNRTDVMEKLLVFNVTKMEAPDFGSQSKTRLANEYVGKIITNYLSDENIFKEIIKNNPEWINSIYERCAARTQKKDQSEVNRLAKKLSKTKVNKLIDATGKDRTEAILIISEGDSSSGKIVEARDPDVHGILPLRGKLLNVNGVHPKTALENKVLQDIMNALGLVIGKKAEISSMNYGKLWVAADADEDGKNISALVINFIFTFWPELFEDQKKPFLHLYQTPLIVARKGKETKYWYAENYDTFDSSKFGKSKGWSVTRAKGLGSLESEDWIACLANPNLYPIIDDGKLRETLDMIFNTDRANDRKEWISGS